jgi:hypothetical protein
MVSTADHLHQVCVHETIDVLAGLFQADPIRAIVDWKHHSGNRLTLFA